MSQPDDRSTVVALLHMFGFEPGEQDVDWLVKSYAQSRAMADALYSVPGVRYEQPVSAADPRVTP